MWTTVTLFSHMFKTKTTQNLSHSSVARIGLALLSLSAE